MTRTCSNYGRNANWYLSACLLEMTEMGDVVHLLFVHGLMCPHIFSSGVSNLHVSALCDIEQTWLHLTLIILMDILLLETFTRSQTT